MNSPHFLRLPALLVGLALSLSACGDDDLPMTDAGTDTNPPPDLCADSGCDLGMSCNPADGVCYCDAASGSVCVAGQLCVESECVANLPEAICNPAGGFEEGTPAFVEVTAAVGLEGVQGVRMGVTDIDGDGWPDLAVRRGAPRPDSFAADGVRRTWILRNNGGSFEDVTQASGFLATRGEHEGEVGRPVEIIAFADVDNDGDLDAFSGMNTTLEEDQHIGERSEILLNDGNGVFTLATVSDIRRERDAVDEPVDVPAGASFVDFDRDGILDLWVPQHNFGSITFLSDRLYRGNGDGTFEDVTVAMGLYTEDWLQFDALNEARAHSRAWGSLVRDLNGDGAPDLLVPSYGRSPNHFWQGSGMGAETAFANRSVSSGYAFDENQEWTDNQFARCFCQSNREAPDCEGVPMPQVGCANNWSHDNDRQAFRLGGNSGQTSAGDVDNDGDLDLLTGEIRHWWAGVGSDGSELLVNNGESDVVFARPGDEATGLGINRSVASWDEGHMTNTFLDFDNDGRLDVYMGASDYPGNRGRLYHQVAPMRFEEVRTRDFFEHNRSHGVVAFDYDRDGDLDLLVGHSRARCSAGTPNNCYETSQVRLFQNTAAPSNWIQLKLVGGEGSNVSAIGAQVLVTYGELQQVLEVDGGHGHYGSQSDLVLHVGLGEACEATVEVRWPNAELTRETFTLGAGHRYILTQGAPVQVAN